MAQDPTVPVDHFPVPIAEPLKEPSRAFDIGGQEGDGPNRQVPHLALLEGIVEGQATPRERRSRRS
jgi:hypothetical protein